MSRQACVTSGKKAWENHQKVLNFKKGTNAIFMLHHHATTPSAQSIHERAALVSASYNTDSTVSAQDAVAGCHAAAVYSSGPVQSVTFQEDDEQATGSQKWLRWSVLTVFLRGMYIEQGRTGFPNTPHLYLRATYGRSATDASH